MKPGLNDHITNLECPDRMRREMEQAMSEHMANTDQATFGQTEAKAKHAKAMYENNQATLQLIESEWGPYVIGKPLKTKFKTSETLQSQGYVGIYRRV